MATGENTFEGGTHGTTVTTANSGGASGDAISTVTLGDGTITYDNTAPAHQLMGIKMTFPATGTNAIRCLWNTAEAGRLVFSFYYQITTLPTATEDVCGIRHASGNMAVLTIGSDGKLIFNNAAGTGISASRATNTIPINTTIRIDFAVQKGTTTSDGYIGYAYYLGDNSAPEFSYESSAQNSGTANIASVFIGRSTGRTQVRTVYYDTVRWSSPVASGFLSPYSPPPGGGGGGSIATLINTFEGGTDGVAISTANSGGASGTAANTIAISDGAIVYSNAFPAHGTMGLRIDLASAGTGPVRAIWNVTQSARFIFSFYYRISNLPTATEDIAGIRNATANMCVLCIGGDGKIIMNNTAGAGITASKSTSNIPINTTIRIDIAVQKGTTTSNGYVGYAYYIGENSLPTFTWESAVQNTGTTDVAQAFIGRSTGRTQANTAYYDTIRWSSPAASSGFLSPHNTGGSTEIVLNTFNYGADGVTVTPANTGVSGNTAASSVPIAAGDAIIFTNSNAVHGVAAVEMTFLGPSAGPTRIIWNTTSANRIVFSFFYYLLSLPTATEDVAGVRHSSGNMCILTIGSDGKFIMQNTAGTGVAASKSTNTVPVQEWIRVDISCAKGTTTSNGTLGYAYYTQTGTTPIFSYESAVQNTGTADITAIFLGRTTNRTEARIVYYDSVRLANPQASGFMGAYIPLATNPTVTLGQDLFDLEPWVPITLGANATDPDGTIISYVWSQDSGPTTVTFTGSGSAITYEPPGLPDGGTYTFSVIVYDNDGLSASATVSHTILAGSEFAIGSDGTFIPLKITGIY